MTTARSIILSYFFIITVFVHINAQTSPSEKRPKIGLVLSGGGAKGLAHIGVLKVLEEAGIPIDYITGTSMGSVVGGLYACGYKADQIKKIADGINWDDLLLDRISRRNITIDEKDEFDRYVGEFPIVKGKVQLPRGLVDGQKISMLLAHYTWPVHNISDFDKLPIPFRCIATDIENVQPVVLKSGFLPDAIRASLAIPTFFNPIEIDGKLLVDGGIVRNFPVEDAREMGADIIIGVEVASGLYKKDQLNTAIRIINQASTYQIAQESERQRKLCNIVIRPDISKYDMFSFNATDSLIFLGEKATREKMPELLKLAEQLKMYKDYSPPTPTGPSEPDSVHISQIKIEGLSKVSKSLVLGNLQLPDSGSITYREIEEGIERVYGTRFFEKVNYKIDPNPSGSLLTLRLKEQPHNYFRFSMNYDQYLKTSVLLNATFRNVLGEGTRLSFDLKLGKYPAFATKYTIHTSLQPNIGMSLKTSFNTFEAKFYTSEQKLAANYDIIHYVTEVDFFSTLSNEFQIRSGFQGELFDISHTLDAYDTINNNVKALSWYARFRFDSYDKMVFPRKGDYFNAEIKSVLTADYKAAPQSTSFWRVIAYYNKYIPISRRIVITPGAYGGFTLSQNVHSAYFNYLGGTNPAELNIFPFQGMKFMAISAKDLAIASLWFRVELWKDKFLTLKTNIARTTNLLEQFVESGTNYWGVGISAGIRTILGPVEVSLSNSNLYHTPIAELHVGYTF